MAPLELFHYTSAEKAKKIAEDGVIRESTGSRRRRAPLFGDGVYLTMLDPRHGRQAIARNNYDGTSAVNPGMTGKVQCAIKLRISHLNRWLEHVGEVEDRDIYVHRGDLRFDDFPECDWEIIPVHHN